MGAACAFAAQGLPALWQSTRLVRSRSLKMANIPDVRHSIKVALCQIPVTASKEDNLATASSYLRQAAINDAKIAVLPECFNSPYDTACFPEYAERLPEIGHPFTSATASPSVQMIRKAARDSGMAIVGGSIPEMTADGKVYNTSVTVDSSGNVIAKHRKVHLFDVNVPGGIQFRESDSLCAGNNITTFSLSGLCEFEVVVGVGICYDLRFPELSMLARGAGADILIFPGAFNMTTGPAHWELLLRARALDNQVYVAACSPARDKSGTGYTAWGHSTIVDPWGRIESTTDENPGIVYATIDLEMVAQVRASIPVSTQRRSDVYELRLVKAGVHP